ncbi:hypothetical protein [Lactococcus hodotermopsidis]|uniref:hypothetical protein n=1 Tax=Pseudolactococcus hodotermopsidis TaxID=2709157 RepID=UPI001E47825C|nr:hypothetical protein [Lactococcus hodotermopsidis]
MAKRLKLLVALDGMLRFDVEIKIIVKTKDSTRNISIIQSTRNSSVMLIPYMDGIKAKSKRKKLTIHVSISGKPSFWRLCFFEADTVVAKSIIATATSSIIVNGLPAIRRKFPFKSNDKTDNTNNAHQQIIIGCSPSDFVLGFVTAAFGGVLTCCSNSFFCSINLSTAFYSFRWFFGTAFGRVARSIVGLIPHRSQKATLSGNSVPQCTQFTNSPLYPKLRNNYHDVLS